MEAKYSPNVKKVISYSREEAQRLNNDQIGIEHLLLGLIREGGGLATKVLKSLEVDLILLKEKLENTIRDNAKTKQANSISMPLTKQAEKALMEIVSEPKQMQSHIIDTQHLMLAILRDEENSGTKIINKMQVDANIFKAELEQIIQKDPEVTDSDTESE